jgi:hypothetical protein
VTLVRPLPDTTVAAGVTEPYRLDVPYWK